MERAASIVAEWMRDCGDSREKFASGKVTRLDRHQRLFLARNGPIYFTTGAGDASTCRKCGYVYFATEFAEILFATAIRPEIKGRQHSIKEAIESAFLPSGCELRFFYQVDLGRIFAC